MENESFKTIPSTKSRKIRINNLEHIFSQSPINQLEITILQ